MIFPVCLVFLCTYLYNSTPHSSQIVLFPVGEMFGRNPPAALGPSIWMATLSDCFTVIPVTIGPGIHTSWVGSIVFDIFFFGFLPYFCGVYPPGTSGERVHRSKAFETLTV